MILATKNLKTIPARTAIALAVCMIGSAPSVYAQSGAPASASGASAPASGASAAVSADTSLGITQVVVTAQRRAQFLDKVPMSISALTQDSLDKQGVTDIAALARVTPGLDAHESDVYGDPNVAIRGISSNAGSATTAIYIDDAPIAMRGGDQTAGGTLFPQLFDLDRVEVLRGPQGTLFGSGAEGGAIRFLTPTPRFDAFSGQVKAGLSVSERGALSAETGIAVGGPIVQDVVAFRASAWHAREGGYIDHVDRDTGAITARNANRSDTSVGRLSLLVKPTADLTIAPSVFFQAEDQKDRDITYEEAGTYRTYNHILQPKHDRFTLSSLAITYDLPTVSVKSITSAFNRHQNRVDDFSYGLASSLNDDGSEEVTGYPDYVAVDQELTRQLNLTQEFRVASQDDDDSKFSWIAGLYLTRAKQHEQQAIYQDIETFTEAELDDTAVDYFGQGGIGADGMTSYLERDRLRDRDVAVYGEATYKIRPDTSVTLGLRAAHNHFDFSTYENGPWAAPSAIDFAGHQDGHAMLPKLSISHDLDPSDLVYATAAKGNRVGGANPSYATIPECGVDLAAIGVSDAPHTYGADSVWSYETGYKGHAFDKRLEFAASAFYVDWSNIQQAVNLPTCQFRYTANMGKALSRGADLQVQYRATRALTLNANVAYTDAHYTQTAYAGTSTDGSPLATKGQALPIPSFTLAAGAEYGWSLDSGKHAFVRGDYQYANAYRRTGPAGNYDYEEALYRQPETSFFSTHAGMTVGAIDWEASVDNLFNARTELMRTHNSPNDPSYQTVSYRPRTLGVSGTYKF
jgi:iron complex outermembrane receptor protein